MQSIQPIIRRCKLETSVIYNLLTINTRQHVRCQDISFSNYSLVLNKIPLHPKRSVVKI